MSEELRRTIYRTLSLRETEDLLEIWRANDRSQWTEMALEVVEEILRERLGELPPRWEEGVSAADEAFAPDERDAEAAITVGMEAAQPRFYHPHQVLRLERRLQQVALGGVVLAFLRALLHLPATQQVVWTFFGQRAATHGLAWGIALVMAGVAAALEGALLYFPLRALGNMLRILMEMERAARSDGEGPDATL